MSGDVEGAISEFTYEVHDSGTGEVLAIRDDALAACRLADELAGTEGRGSVEVRMVRPGGEGAMVIYQALAG
jgi:hypothetical protein